MPSPWLRSISAHVRARLTSETPCLACTCAGWCDRPWRPVVVACDAVRGVRACLAATETNSRRQAAVFRGQTGVFARSPLGDSTITPPSSWGVKVFESSSPDMGQTSIIGAVNLMVCARGSLVFHVGSTDVGRASWGRRWGKDGPWQRGDLRLKGRLGHWGEAAWVRITPQCLLTESAPSFLPHWHVSAARWTSGFS